MAEDSTGGSILDSRQFTYFPVWAKYLVLIVFLLVLLGASSAVYLAIVAHAHGETLVFFLSVAQTAAFIVVFFLVILFSRRDGDVQKKLESLAEGFYTHYVMKALAKVTIPGRGLDSFEVTNAGKKDIFGHLLHMKSGDFDFPLWIGLNVKRVFVIYFVPLSESFGKAEAEKIFYFTFRGAEKVGFHMNFEEAEVEGEKVLSIWMTVETDDELLLNPQQKIFWAQDIAMMTESFLRTACRHNIDLSLRKAVPAPL